MKRINLLPLFLVLLLSVYCAFPQGFYRSASMSLDPAQVIIDNYSPIRLMKGPEDAQKLNAFSRDNPYTYLQLITDSKKGIYHILYQTNFTGHLLFMACSNNLYSVFFKKEKPMNMFNNCMNGIEEELVSVRIIDKAIDCILERLAYCGR